MGMKAKALETLKTAMATAQKMTDPELGRIYGLQAWAGDIEGARKSTEALPDEKKCGPI